MKRNLTPLRRPVIWTHGHDQAHGIKKKKRRGGVITVVTVCVSVILISVVIPAAAFTAGFSAGSYMSRAGIIPWLICGMLAELFCGRLSVPGSHVCDVLAHACSKKPETGKYEGIRST